MNQQNKQFIYELLEEARRLLAKGHEVEPPNQEEWPHWTRDDFFNFVKSLIKTLTGTDVENNKEIITLLEQIESGKLTATVPPNLEELVREYENSKKEDFEIHEVTSNKLRAWMFQEVDRKGGFTVYEAPTESQLPATEPPLDEVALRRSPLFPRPTAMPTKPKKPAIPVKYPPQPISQQPISQPPVVAQESPSGQQLPLSPPQLPPAEIPAQSPVPQRVTLYLVKTPKTEQKPPAQTPTKTIRTVPAQLLKTIVAIGQRNLTIQRTQTAVAVWLFWQTGITARQFKQAVEVFKIQHPHETKVVKALIVASLFLEKYEQARPNITSMLQDLHEPNKFDVRIATQIDSLPFNSSVVSLELDSQKNVITQATPLITSQPNFLQKLATSPVARLISRPLIQLGEQIISKLSLRLMRLDLFTKETLGLTGPTEQPPSATSNLLVTETTKKIQEAGIPTTPSSTTRSDREGALSGTFGVFLTGIQTTGAIFSTFLSKLLPFLSHILRGLFTLAKGLFSLVVPILKGLFSLGGLIAKGLFGIISALGSGIAGIGSSIFAAAGLVGAVAGISSGVIILGIGLGIGIFAFGFWSIITHQGAFLTTGSEVQIESPFIDVRKSTARTAYDNGQLPDQIGYTIAIKPKIVSSKLTQVVVSDNTRAGSKNGELQLFQNSWSVDEINRSGWTQDFTVPLDASAKNSLEDTIIVNTVTVRANVEGEAAPQTATRTIIIKVGNPPETCPLDWPTPKGRIDQGPYGATTHDEVGQEEAIDIKDPILDSKGIPIEGMEVKATHAGTAIGYNDQWGGDDIKIIGTCNGLNFQSWYVHLGSRILGNGQSQSVTRGTVIGTVGKTGYAAQPHLHYMFTNGLTMSPPYIPKTVPKGCLEYEACGVNW